jgi:peroxin-6
MLKAVTRQASAVDAKIRAINNSNTNNNIADPVDSHPGHRGAAGPISTAYFFDHFATPEDVAVTVTEQDFLDAHRELVPSVSAGELAHYERVRAAFEGSSKDKESQSQNQKDKMEGGGPAAATRLALTGRRTASGASARSAGGKGKGKAVAVGGKGKGKAVAVVSEDEYEVEGDDDDDDAVNGAMRDKGKGKEVAPPIAATAAAPFGDGAGSGDEGLYD